MPARHAGGTSYLPCCHRQKAMRSHVQAKNSCLPGKVPGLFMCVYASTREKKACASWARPSSKRRRAKRLHRAASSMRTLSADPEGALEGPLGEWVKTMLSMRRRQVSYCCALKSRTSG